MGRHRRRVAGILLTFARRYEHDSILFENRRQAPRGLYTITSECDSRYQGYGGYVLRVDGGLFLLVAPFGTEPSARTTDRCLQPE